MQNSNKHEIKYKVEDKKYTVYIKEMVAQPLEAPDTATKWGGSVKWQSSR